MTIARSITVQLLLLNSLELVDLCSSVALEVSLVTLLNMFDIHN